jgi:hypothetical protein
MMDMLYESRIFIVFFELKITIALHNVKTWQYHYSEDTINITRGVTVSLLGSDWQKVTKRVLIII